MRGSRVKVVCVSCSELSEQLPECPGRSYPRCDCGGYFVSSLGVTVQLSACLVNEVDRLASELGKRAAGVSISRSATIRACLERGIERMNKEIQTKPKKH